MCKYNKNVFLNCPYDEKYKGNMYAIIFTIIVLGFYPRLALEVSDSSENRIDKITKLIRESKYSIHDLSRVKSTTENEYYRLNMPFELGIDFACKQFFHDSYNDKKFLVLEKVQYDYQKALSDISGMDVKSYLKDHSSSIVKCVRDWFADTANVRYAPSAEIIFCDYTDDFQPYLFDRLIKLGISPNNYSHNYFEDITINEFIDFVKEWKQTKEKYMRVITIPRDFSIQKASVINE
jgi:hypothetical protein